MKFIRTILTIFFAACCSTSGFANPAKEQTVEAICNAKSPQCRKACENYRNDIQETQLGATHLSECLYQINSTKK
jgi:hypothetical protein